MAHRPGALVMVGDREGRPEATTWLSADGAGAEVLGRHLECGLRVGPLHRDVSLRHLAILIRPDPQPSSDRNPDIVSRVIDLHTKSGFCVPDGRHLSSLEGRGLLTLGLSDLFVALIPTGWGPSRQSLESLRSKYGFEERKSHCFDATRQQTHSSRATLSWVDPMDHACKVRGELRVFDGLRTRSFEVNESQLAGGLLIGRYDRCELQSSELQYLSRVHNLLITDGDDILLVDCASTCGTFSEGRPVRTLQVENGSAWRAGPLDIRWVRAGDPPDEASHPYRDSPPQPPQ
ncbi:MAG: FHA domain-containing protein [Myxococcota bacterium]